jgi:hypothetical protein
MVPERLARVAMIAIAIVEAPDFKSSWTNLASCSRFALLRA